MNLVFYWERDNGINDNKWYFMENSIKENIRSKYITKSVPQLNSATSIFFLKVCTI